MLRSLIRRVLEAAVVLFAILGFLYVPLGGRTGMQHLKAIYESPAAERAMHGLGAAVRQLRDKLADAVRPKDMASAADGSSGSAAEQSEKGSSTGKGRSRSSTRPVSAGQVQPVGADSKSRE